MSTLSHRLTVYPRAARAIAVTALLGASFLAAPLTVAYAADATEATQQGGADAANVPAETVEQRITNLHTELKITPAEEAKWNNVAQAMRENAAAMEKLAAARAVQAPSSMTAIDDLKGYEKYAQAHVDGLKNLLSSFETLYATFPDTQKKTADQVFQTFGLRRPAHT
jgi:periplasmic protein CpxP/Spy